MASRAHTAGSRKVESGISLGFKLKFWTVVDALCGSKDAAEYKQVVHRLIFFNHIEEIGGAVVHKASYLAHKGF